MTTTIRVKKSACPIVISTIMNPPDSIQAFKSRQQGAFARWVAAGQVTHLAEEERVAEADDALALGDGKYVVQRHVHGNVWQIPLTGCCCLFMRCDRALQSPSMGFAPRGQL
ncbi:MAG: hypothetical protein IBX49_08075, partial [Gammaproteobacteria bacterium]|nr:hypothetical protein [Gammaproteobacteria bacterium]